MATDVHREFDLAQAAAERLRGEGFGGAVAVIQTGSGIPAPDLAQRATLPWHAIDGFPRATAPGHRGALHRGLLAGRPVLVLEGRLHLYEGHDPAHVVRPIRAVGLLGVRRALLSNAVGGLRPDLRAGDVVHVVDHLNRTGADPLRGPHDPRFGDRFVVLAGRAHCPRLGALAAAAAKELGIALPQGVYAAVHGPTFETPAEVRALRAAGADVVGMSTVHEVIAATQLGMATLVLSFVANAAGVVADGATAESEVLDAGRRLGGRVTRILEGVVARLPEEDA